MNDEKVKKEGRKRRKKQMKEGIRKKGRSKNLRRNE